MTEIRITTIDEMIQARSLYHRYTELRKAAEDACDDYLEGQGARQEWARLLILQQEAWDAYLDFLGLTAEARR